MKINISITTLHEYAQVHTHLHNKDKLKQFHERKYLATDYTDKESSRSMSLIQSDKLSLKTRKYIYFKNTFSSFNQFIVCCFLYILRQSIEKQKKSETKTP